MKRILVSLLNVFLLAFCQAQQSEQAYIEFIGKQEFKAKRVVPSSPEAAELGKYGNVPVSLFTGTPKVNIPLYDLTGKKLSLPLSMSYNAGGFKPDEIATWVGLGWSLNAGGMITRSVLGNPDIASNYFKASNNYATPPPISDEYATYDYMTDIQKNINEAQPDVYYYNFGNHSGKFFITADQVVIKKEKDNLKISHCITCNADGSTFTIIDEQGVSFVFNVTEVSSMQTDDGTSEAHLVKSYTYASTWYLSSITSADGKEQITFNYLSPDNAHTQYNNFLPNNSITYSASQPNYFQYEPSGSVIASPPTVSIKRRYLQSISLLVNGVQTSYVDVGSVADQRLDLRDTDFPGERLIQFLKIYSRDKEGTYALAKQYNFSFGYFINPGSTEYYHKRLQLQSIQEMPLDGSTPTKPAYSFEYNTSIPVPSTTNASIDHWGFYNNVDLVTNLVPTVNIGGQDFGLGADREPNLAGSSCALLNKITYPTGGYTTLEYELNQAKDGDNGSAIRAVGGVRIRQVVDWSFANKQAIVKSYSYILDDGTTSGQAIFPVYAQSSIVHHLPITQMGGSGSDEHYIYYRTISASAILGLGSIQGSHIGYSQVIESQVDLSTSSSLGKTVYNYKIAGFNAHDDNIANGDLLQQKIYDNKGKILHEQINTYSNLSVDGIVGYTVRPSSGQDNLSFLCKYSSNGTTHYAWKHGTEDVPVCIESRYYGTKLKYSGYVVAAQYKQLMEQVERKYDQLSDTYVFSTKKFTYGNTAHILPTSIEQSTTNNEVVITEKKYALDFDIPNSASLDPPTQAIKLLQDKNVVNAPIETIQYRQNSNGSNRQYIGASMIVYDAAQPYPSNLYSLRIAQPLTSFQSSSTNGIFTYNSNYELLGTYTYDAAGNMIQQARNKDIPTAYIWDYANTRVSAEVVNADAASIAYCSFETGNAGNWDEIADVLVNRVSGSITGTYSYNLVTNKSITKSGLTVLRQFTVSYWSKNGAITVNTNVGIASINGGTPLGRNGWYYYQHLLPQGSTIVSLTAANANIDELRLYPSDAQMTSHCYNMENGLLISQCTPNNRINYYEYDSYNRLVNIKDDAGYIVKNYKYNYGLGAALAPSPKTLFYNALTTANFTKSNCASGTPTVVTYTIPYGKYAATSQLAIDGMVQADITANGQNYANQNGECLFYNTVQGGFFFKQCDPTQGSGSRVRYNVDPGTYSSAIDQVTANNLAIADVQAKGQDYANINGTCSCGEEGKRIINGACETGTRWNDSVEWTGGQWKCTYHYEFSDLSTTGPYYSFSSVACPIH